MEKKRKVRKPRYDRIIGAAVIAGGLVFTGVKGLANLVNKNKDKSVPVSFITDSETKGLGIDNFGYLTYVANSDFSVFDDNFELVQELDAGTEMNVYNMYSKENDNTLYMYCEIPATKFIGLVTTDTILDSVQIGTTYLNFSEIYKVTGPSIEIKDSPYVDSETEFELKEGDIFFTDAGSEKWKYIRTSDGKVGRWENRLENVEEILDGNIVKVKDNINGFNENDRMLSIGATYDNSSKDNILYYDEKGFLRVTQVEREYLYDENLEYSNSISNSSNYGQNIKSDVSNVVQASSLTDNELFNAWQNNYSSGVYGIDISASMKPNDLDNLLNEKDVGFGIIRMGVTGYGVNDGNLKIAENSTVTHSEEIKKSVRTQMNIFKNHDVNIMGYFYSTETNPKEGIEVAEYIENCIDELGGEIIPVLDCEAHMNEDPIYDRLAEKEDDRVYFLNNNNYYSFLSQGGKTIDLNSLMKMEEVELIRLAKSDSNLINYINYCQDLKAQGIASVYKKLYDDGYIKGNLALLYTGNQAVSKDSYITTIKNNSGLSSFQKIVLFKYDDVKRYLTDKNSPYFISENFDLKVWYADYTNSNNHLMLGDACIMTQNSGDKKYNESLYDENYAYKEFLDKFFYNNKILESKIIEIDER